MRGAYGGGLLQTRYVRLTEPLVRERGELRAATWDEALDRTAAQIRRILSENGPDSAGIFSCSRATNEVNFLAQKLARVVFGNHNIDSCNRT
jgi:formate dehydrogenase major subunit